MTARPVPLLTLLGVLGVSDTALMDVFPNLRNFDAGVHDLGFLNA